MYKYIGTGWLVGIPARDISKEEFESMDKEKQALVKSCGLYELEVKISQRSKSPILQSDDTIDNNK